MYNIQFYPVIRNIKELEFSNHIQIYFMVHHRNGYL